MAPWFLLRVAKTIKPLYLSSDFASRRKTTVKAVYWFSVFGPGERTIFFFSEQRGLLNQFIGSRFCFEQRRLLNWFIGHRFLLRGEREREDFQTGSSVLFFCSEVRRLLNHFIGPQLLVHGKSGHFNRFIVLGLFNEEKCL